MTKWTENIETRLWWFLLYCMMCFPYFLRWAFAKYVNLHIKSKCPQNHRQAKKRKEALESSPCRGVEVWAAPAWCWGPTCLENGSGPNGTRGRQGPRPGRVEEGGAETLAEGIPPERNRYAPPREKGQMGEEALLRGTEWGRLRNVAQGKLRDAGGAGGTCVILLSPVDHESRWG